MKKILFSIAMLVFMTAAFSQNNSCFEVLQPTFISKESNGTYTLSIRYNTTGTKALEVVVYCGNTQILNTCFKNKGNGTQVYSGLVCTSGVSALLTLHEGSCETPSCGSMIIEGPAGGPLPVKLGSFSAVRSKQVVSLNWNTEFEIDSKEFIIERAEGTEFRSLGTITSKGNSSTKRSYSFNDKNENAGNTYYRLKNVELNGKFTYSEIRSVKGIGAVNDVTVFPNPARSNSKISVVGATENSSIQLIDFSGKVLKNMNSNTVNSIDLSGVKNGSYLIRIIDKLTNEVVNKKLTVSN